MTSPASTLARCFVYPTAFLVGLVIFPDSSAQWEFGLIVFASFWLMAWSGHAALFFIVGDSAAVRDTLFLKALLGQFVLLAAWFVASPILFIINMFFELPALLPLVALGALLWMVIKLSTTRTSFAASLHYDDPMRIVFTVFAAACLFKISTYYSVRAGALGLDTHQHIYFVVDLYNSGYLKLNAGDTPWLERYPKGLHALAALWGLPGLGDHLGSSLKIMPGLQILLVTFALVEICSTWLRRQSIQRTIQVGWWIFIVAGTAYILFRGTRFVYPIADLNSTARLSSAAVLFLPGVVGCLMMVYNSRRMAGLAGLALPFAGALAAKFNPALAIAFFAVSVPLWLATVGFTVFYDRTAWRPVALGLLGGGMFGLVLLLADPFYIGLLASYSGSFSSVLETLTGLRLLPQTSSMLASLPPSISGGGIIQAITNNLSLPGAGLESYIVPDSTMVISKKLIAGARVLSCSALVLWLIALLQTRRAKDMSVRAMPAVMQVALLVAVWMDGVLGRTVAEVVGMATIEASVLSTYARSFSNILVLFSLPVYFILSVTLLVQILSRFFSYSDKFDRWAVWTGATLIIVLTLSLRWWPLGSAPPAESLGWWHPVKEAQLDAFQDMEEALPERAKILADATAATLNGREKWILPTGEATAYLSVARRSYIFNVRLGDSYAFSFADLDDNFCHGTPRSARSFIEENNIEYLFTADRSAVTREQVLAKSYCGISYADLGVAYPPLVTGPDGLAIYELKHE